MNSRDVSEVACEAISFELERLDEHVRAAVLDLPVSHYGSPGLEAITGGIRAGGYTALGAQPGLGKTTLMLQIADEQARRGNPVLFFSFEMTQTRLLPKSLVRLSGGRLTLADIAGAHMSPEDGAALNDAVERYRETIAPNISFHTKPVSVVDISAMVSSCEQQTGKKPQVYIDYLQLLACSGATPFADERLAIAEAVQGLRQIANTHGVPVFVISSINRASYAKGAPDLSAFAGSSSIDYSFDAILFLAVEGTGAEAASNLARPRRPVRVTALKNRYGPLGSAALTLDTEHACFYDTALENE